MFKGFVSGLLSGLVLASTGFVVASVVAPLPERFSATVPSAARPSEADKAAAMAPEAALPGPVAPEGDQTGAGAADIAALDQAGANPAAVDPATEKLEPENLTTPDSHADLPAAAGSGVAPRAPLPGTAAETRSEPATSASGAPAAPATNADAEGPAPIAGSAGTATEEAGSVPADATGALAATDSDTPPDVETAADPGANPLDVAQLTQGDPTAPQIAPDTAVAPDTPVADSAPQTLADARSDIPEVPSPAGRDALAPPSVGNDTGAALAPLAAPRPDSTEAPQAPLAPGAIALGPRILPLGAAPETPSAPAALDAGASDAPAGRASDLPPPGHAEDANALAAGPTVDEPGGATEGASLGVPLQAPTGERAEAQAQDAETGEAAADLPDADEGRDAAASTQALAPASSDVLGTAPRTDLRSERLPQIGQSVLPGLPAELAPEITLDAASDALLPALVRNARPFHNPDRKPPFVILLRDKAVAGLDLAAVAQSDVPMTLVVDPAQPGAADRAAVWRAAGQEVALLSTALPPGASVGDVEVTLEALDAALPQALALIEAGSGTAALGRDTATALMPGLQARGFGLVTWDAGLKQADQVARREGLPAARIFRDLDARGESAPVIRRYLDRAAFKAQQDGQVVVIGELRPETLAALHAWALEGRVAGLALAPLSAVLGVQH